MADLKNYFQQEIVALRGLGKDAAQKNPALVSFLATPKNDSEHDDRSRRYLKKIRAGLVSVSSKQSTRLDSKSTPCRGIETTFLFDRKHFNSEGEIFLLGTIFSQFLRIYTTPANFHRTITKITNGNEYPEPVFFGHNRMEGKVEEFQ